METSFMGSRGNICRACSTWSVGQSLQFADFFQAINTLGAVGVMWADAAVD